MRFLAVLTILALAAVAAAHAQTATLNEDEAVRLAQANESFVALGRAQLDLARSHVSGKRLWPNPTLEFTREDAGGAEDFLTLSQSFDLSGRRSLLRRAAALRVDAAEHDVAWQRLDLETAVRLEFNRAASQQEIARALTAWLERIRAAVETAARLQAGGEVSGYDRRRLDRERIAAEARLAAARGSAEAAQRRLAALLGVERLEDVTLQASAPRTIADEAEIAAIAAQRPDLAALAQRMEAARLETRAARRWLPELDLTGGTKRTDDENGSIVGLAVGLPLFDRNQPSRLRASAELAMLEAERSILLARVRGEAAGLASEARELRRAASLFRDEALPASARLTATAEAAYRAGEVGILELLDAYRTTLDAELEAAEMEHRARETEIALARTLGGVTR